MSKYIVGPAWDTNHPEIQWAVVDGECDQVEAYCRTRQQAEMIAARLEGEEWAIVQEEAIAMEIAIRARLEREELEGTRFCCNTFPFAGEYVFGKEGGCDV